MNKKVLLITPPYHSGVVEVAGRWAPLSLLYVAGAIRKAGLDVTLFDAMSAFKNFGAVRRKIAEIAPDYVGVSSITATLPSSLKICRIAKEVDGRIKTFMGGVHPTFMDQETLEMSAGTLDVIVRGEGEKTTEELFRAWEKDGDLSDVAGISRLDENGVFSRTVPRPFLSDLEEYSPAFDLLDHGLYKYFVVPDSRLGGVSTSRGCDHSCSFCSQQKFWEKMWRGRAPAAVVEEIKLLNAKYGVNVFLFTDEYPTKDQERWSEILDRIIRAKLDILLLMETRAGDIVRDEKLLPKYRKAGVIHIYVGLESSEQETLNFIEKDLTVETSKASLELIRKHGMLSETSFVIGFPEETKSSVRSALDAAINYNPDMAHFLFITPWPYADLWDKFRDRVRVRDYSKYNLVEPIIEPFAMTRKELDLAIISCYKDFYMRKFREYSDYKDELRRSYMLTSLKLIMKSSFLVKKMAKLSLNMPHMAMKDIISG